MHSAPGRWKPVSAGIYFQDPPKENFVYCVPVGDVGLLESHQDLVVSFASYYISKWTLDMNTWENTGEVEEESTKHSIDSDNIIYAMLFDDPNPEEVGKEDRLEVHDKVWEDLASKISIAITQTFRVGALLESFSLRQDRAADLFQKLCANMDAGRTWDDKGIPTTNLHVVDLEAQELEKIPEWREKLGVALE